MEEEIKLILDDHEKRISKLEEKKIKSPINIVKFSGLNGGINLLIKNEFFNIPKSLIETKNELARESYHYGAGAIAKALSVYFVKNKKILTRVKENKIWKYVIRK